MNVFLVEHDCRHIDPIRYVVGIFIDLDTAKTALPDISWFGGGDEYPNSIISSDIEDGCYSYYRIREVRLNQILEDYSIDGDDED